MRRAGAALVLVLGMAGAVEAAAPGDVATVQTCFTPRRRCTGVIVAAIDRARREIWVQAYGFTSAPILAALVAAHRRGVDVSAILDKSNARRSRRRSGARTISAAGIPVWIDHRSGIAHNKVIVIDARFVVTGSFNFTAAADRRNAENVVVLDSPAIAAQYLANWRSLLTAATPYRLADPPPDAGYARSGGLPDVRSGFPARRVRD